MDNRNHHAAELILNSIAYPSGKFREIICDLASALRENYGRSMIDADALRGHVNTLTVRVLQDEKDELKANTSADSAQHTVHRAIFRLGTLFAILSASGDEIRETQIGNIISFVKQLDIMSAPELEQLIAEFEADGNITKANDHAARLMAVDKARPKNIAVSEYSHPMDEKIVSVLDTPLVNGVFKKMVDVFSDAQYGQMMAGAIPVTPNNFPELNAIVDDCARIVGIPRPYVVVTNTIRGLNAMTFGSDEKPYVAISALIVKFMKPEQLRFIVGHEFGHIAMSHVVYHVAANVFHSFSYKIPMVGPVAYDLIAFNLNAWSRRSEITADRAGLICCGDVETAKRALLQLESAFSDINEKIDIDGYIAQSRSYRSGSVLRRGAELVATHPILPKRIEALELFSNSVSFYKAMNLCVPGDAISVNELNKKVEEILKVL